ncbi:hypothetical protein ALC62_04049 [Cyphomyrmex costatus]|uniref:Uncharacterized protein n=1 Tax=Cyphomyrmex costatus TaxID=456900 RepID=A0A195CWK1_9HYME|nr:hypothetical protein ALC62_04049 [Cyphomyrmex costatus]
MDNLVKVAKSAGLSSLLRCLSKALLESGKKLAGRLPATLMPRYNVPRYFQPSSHADPSLFARERSLFALPHSTPPFTTGEAGPAASRNDPRGGSSNERLVEKKVHLASFRCKTKKKKD